MYELRPFEAELWAIVDADDRQLYVGTLRDCEQWLDRQENLERRTMPREAPLAARGWLSRLLASLASVFRRRPASPPPAGAAGTWRGDASRPDEPAARAPSPAPDEVGSRLPGA